MKTLTFGAPPRNPGRRRYNSSRWKRLSKQVIIRDHRQCQIRGPGCLGLATQADHIIPSDLMGEDDPLFWDPDNLQAACAPCNRRKWAGVAEQPIRSPLIRDFSRSRP